MNGIENYKEEDTSMMHFTDEIKKGLYYIYKKQNIYFYKMNKKFFSNSYIYSIVNDIYPFFNEDEETEYFSSCYKVRKGLIKNVLLELEKIDDEYLQEFRNNGNDSVKANAIYPTYWDFLDRISIRRHSEEDWYVSLILRYCYLENNNFKNIIDNFTKRENSPVEYQSLSKPFSEEELNLQLYSDDNNLLDNKL